jgi:DNA topoisomerase-1
MQVKRGRFGLFWACTGYPQCHYTEPYGEKETLDMDCPLCGKGKIRIRRTKIGKRFYVCSDKKCEFIAWTHPHAIPCPACEHPFLVEKKNARSEISLKCPKSGCKHQQPLPEKLAQEIANREDSKTGNSKKGAHTQSEGRRSRQRSKKH